MARERSAQVVGWRLESLLCREWALACNHCRKYVRDENNNHSTNEWAVFKSPWLFHDTGWWIGLPHSGIKLLHCNPQYCDMFGAHSLLLRCFAGRACSPGSSVEDNPAGNSTMNGLPLPQAELFFWISLNKYNTQNLGSEKKHLEPYPWKSPWKIWTKFQSLVVICRLHDFLFVSSTAPRGPNRSLKGRYFLRQGPKPGATGPLTFQGFPQPEAPRRQGAIDFGEVVVGTWHPSIASIIYTVCIPWPWPLGKAINKNPVNF